MLLAFLNSPIHLLVFNHISIQRARYKVCVVPVRGRRRYRCFADIERFQQVDVTVSISLKVF